MTEPRPATAVQDTANTLDAIPAIHDDDSKSLDDLKVVRPTATDRRQTLKGFRTIVIGAGPAGLIYANAAASLGADVTVFEQAGDPRGSDPGYTDRSFNITLEAVGRYVLTDETVWRGGNWLIGRAIHEDGNSEASLASYGDRRYDQLISIPRPVLRQNMVNQALASGVTIEFHTKVVHLNPAAGRLQADNGLSKKQYDADLIVICDGLHSIADDVLRDTGESFTLTYEPYYYLTAQLHPEYKHQLSLKYIHFWVNRDTGSFTLGLPTIEGNVNLIIASPFKDAPDRSYPLVTSDEADTWLTANFPDIISRSPRLTDQLTTRRRSRFVSKEVSAFRLSDKCVIVGDAGCAFPPWAGFGANSSMFGASSLVYMLEQQNGKTGSVLIDFEKQQKALSRILLDYVDAQARFFNGPVADNPSGRQEQSLAPHIRKVYEILGKH